MQKIGAPQPVKDREGQTAGYRAEAGTPPSQVNAEADDDAYEVKGNGVSAVCNVYSVGW